MRHTVQIMLASVPFWLAAAPPVQAQNAGGSTIYVVRYIEVAPGSQKQAVGLVKKLADASRKEAGAVRFEVFQQMSRPNHFSVVEIWKDRKAYETHITAEHTKKFREQLTPMSGALYDERLYKVL